MQCPDAVAAAVMKLAKDVGATVQLADPPPHPCLAVQIDPQLGGCLVYLPASSAMRGAGPNGTRIGAEVAYRYRDSVLTTLPLWDPQTGVINHQIARLHDLTVPSTLLVHADQVIE